MSQLTNDLVERVFVEIDEILRNMFQDRITIAEISNGIADAIKITTRQRRTMLSDELMAQEVEYIKPIVTGHIINFTKQLAEELSEKTLRRVADRFCPN